MEKVEKIFFVDIFVSLLGVGVVAVVITTEVVASLPRE